MRGWRCILAWATLALPAVAHGTLLADWSLSEVVARSDLVAVGTVGSRTSYYDPSSGRMMTDTVVHVDRVMLGPPMVRFTVTQAGGTLGEETVEIVGDAQLKPGHRFLLFTYGHPDGRRYLVGMSLGAYRVSPAGPGSGDLEEFGVQDIEVPLAGAEGIEPPPGRRSVDLGHVARVIDEVHR